jgi:hypothetical protein
LEVLASLGLGELMADCSEGASHIFGRVDCAARAIAAHYALYPNFDLKIAAAAGERNSAILQYIVPQPPAATAARQI